jgi:hypothetical protein
MNPNDRLKLRDRRKVIWWRFFAATLGVEQAIRLEVDMPPSRSFVCCVKPLFELLTEGYPAPVCNDCHAAMFVRIVVSRTDDGTQKEVRSGFQCPHCRALLPVRSENKAMRLLRRQTLPFAG